MEEIRGSDARYETRLEDDCKEVDIRRIGTNESGLEPEVMLQKEGGEAAGLRPWFNVPQELGGKEWKRRKSRMIVGAWGEKKLRTVQYE